MRETKVATPVPLSRFNNYTLAIIVAFLAGILCFIPLIIYHVLAFGEVPPWLFDWLNVVWGFLFVSTTVSGAGYCAKLFDIPLQGRMPWHWRSWLDIKSAAKNFFKNINGEAIGLWIAVPAALALIFAKLILHITVPYASALTSGIAELVLTISYASRFGGMGNRLGRTADYLYNLKGKPFKEWFSQQHINYVLSILTGLMIGSVLAGTFIGLGIASGGIFPLVLFGIELVGVCMSASGYCGRIADFLLGHKAIVPAIKDAVSDKPQATTLSQRWKSSETKGTAIGVTAGLILGGIGCGLIIAGIATLPLFGIGLPKLVIGMLFVVTAVSASGGLGNRLGSVHDKWKEGATAKPSGSDVNRITQRLNNTRQSTRENTVSLSEPENKTISSANNSSSLLGENPLNSLGIFAKRCAIQREDEEFTLMSAPSHISRSLKQKAT